MSDQFAIDVHFYRLSEELRPYVTALYCFDINCADDVLIEDRLHPEWAAIRFIEGKGPVSVTTFPHEISGSWTFVATGPTSKTIKIGISRSRIWTLGLHPAGWAKYIPVSAREFADQVVDGFSHEAFATFHPIFEQLRLASPDADEAAQRIDSYLREHDDRPVPSEEMILACQQALRDPEISDVTMLAERLKIGRRTLERLCGRYFGFPPKLLLRRQRFLRSLARFMLEPKHNWSKALDGQYFDQAHFVRDFRSFMGMTPSEYADSSKPLIDCMIAQRLSDQGVVPESDLPTFLRYGGKN